MKSNERNKNSVLLSRAGCQFSLQGKHQLHNCHAHARWKKRVIGASQTEHLRPLQTSTSGENNAGQLTQGEATVPAGAPVSTDQHG